MIGESRTYVVGLPVVITVDDNGGVTYEIDTSEAGVAIRDLDDVEYLPATVMRDAIAVDEAHDARTWTPTRVTYVEGGFTEAGVFVSPAEAQAAARARQARS